MGTGAQIDGGVVGTAPESQTVVALTEVVPFATSVRASARVVGVTVADWAIRAFALCADA